MIQSVNRHSLSKLVKELLPYKPIGQALGRTSKRDRAASRLARDDEASTLTFADDVAAKSEPPGVLALSGSTSYDRYCSGATSGTGNALSALMHQPPTCSQPGQTAERDSEVAALLARPTAMQRETMARTNLVASLVKARTFVEEQRVDRFRSDERVQEFCPQGTNTINTKLDCMKMHNTTKPCGLVHLKRLIKPHTDVSLGDCSYLDTCRNMEHCKYIHYAVDTYNAHFENRADQGNRRNIESLNGISRCLSSSA